MLDVWLRDINEIPSSFFLINLRKPISRPDLTGTGLNLILHIVHYSISVQHVAGCEFCHYLILIMKVAAMFTFRTLVALLCLSGIIDSVISQHCRVPFNQPEYLPSYQETDIILRTSPRTLAIHPRNVLHYRSDVEQPVAEELECGDPLSQAGAVRSPQNTGLCPWEYIADHNATRIPHTIYKARCLSCTGECINPVNNSAKINRLFSKCTEVYHNIKVLFRSDNPCVGQTGLLRFEERVISIPVACVCARL
ncbi:uncharacterized protein LOC121430502 [Lytechinus variegatus]|uniref:uncharacterized protein LOC121430502 n=1 Tax=Lytechinus variegatus TaxID=7654 RepID=UPI001BB25EF0|nr:uncharacterized protein LOC121430502 [Lytechinus variegatus]